MAENAAYVSAADGALDAVPGASSDPNRISKPTLIMLIALISCTFSGSFTQVMMNIALPDVSHRFAIDLTTANWVVIGYNVMAGTAICAAAPLLRRIGFRGVCRLGAGCLVAGSVVGVFAMDFWMLVGARLAQAIAGGLFFPLVTTAIEAIVPKRHQGTLFAVNSGCIGIGQAVGPLVTGAILTTIGLNWTFLCPLALGVYLLVASFTMIVDVEALQRAPIDVPSLFIAFAGLAVLMYGFSEITHYVVPALACVACGVAVLAVFAWRQLRGLPRRGKRALLDVSVLGIGTYTVGLLLIMLGMMAVISMGLLLPLYYEGTAAMSAFEAGVFICFPLVVYGLVSMVAGRLFDRHPELPLTSFGFATILAGLVAIHFVAETGSVWGVFACSFIVYTGVSFIVPPAKASEMAALPANKISDGASVNSTMVQIAESFGAALFVGVLSADVTRLTGAGTARAAAYAHGFSDTIWISIVFAAFALILAVAYHLHTQKRAKQSA